MCRWIYLERISERVIYNLGCPGRRKSQILFESPSPIMPAFGKLIQGPDLRKIFQRYLWPELRGIRLHYVYVALRVTKFINLATSLEDVSRISLNGANGVGICTDGSLPGRDYQQRFEPKFNPVDR